MHAKRTADNLRTRKNTLRLRGFDYSLRRIYFVTIVTLNRRKIFLNRVIARATLDCLLQLREKRSFNLYQYCLMPDHFHALIGSGPSGLSLSAICGAFKSLSTTAYWRWSEGRLWQPRFFDHIIRNEQDFCETTEYIRMNPVRKGLVSHWQDWPFTGAIDRL